MWLLILELLGWLLLIAGLVLIGVMVSLALDRQVLEAMAFSFAGTIVFRAGVGFVRLTTAARLATQVAAAKGQADR